MSSPSKGVLVDYENHDYRGFLFVVHEDHGILMLHCTRKPEKGPHFQLPGGHIDEHEFIAAAANHRHCGSDNARAQQLLTAGRMGAARELFEETGMDFRSALDRLRPAILRSKESSAELLRNEFKNRLYYTVFVTDCDFPAKKSDYAPHVPPQEMKSPMKHPDSDILLKISHEHSGYDFEKEPRVAAEKLKHHSGGAGSKSLLMAMARDIEKMS